MFLANSKVFLKRFAMPIAATVLVAACGSDNDRTVEVPTPEPEPVPTEYSYEVTVLNLTHGQPLSPITVALHGDEMLWQIGMPASVALEKLAEGGDNADLLAMESVVASNSAEGALMPGLSTSVTVSTTSTSATHLSVATMLVNTNDAFSGLTGLELSMLAVDASKTWHLNVYDAGTEANTEAMGTIPGPADSGTGYDQTRDDIDLVAMHPGVVSKDDGLTNSVLTQAHRFDNPSIKLTITRTK